MADLVTLDFVKLWLKRDAAIIVEDDVLEFCRDVAQELVKDYVKQRHYENAADLTAWKATVDAWTDLTAPAAVKAAIVRLVGDLDYDRGDLSAAEQIKNRRPGELPDAVTGLLHRLRDPALA